jgi:hypothetical protein
MKKNFLLVFGLLVWAIFFLSACNTKKDSSPCDGKGNLCIENKLDTDVTITLQPVHDQFPLQKDYMKCSELTGNKVYTVTITTSSHENDTTIMILPCDNKLLIIK